MRVSVCTWYIWAIGSTTRLNGLPPLSGMPAPPSGVLRAGEPVPHEALPGYPAVARDPQPAARAAALQVPRLHLELPHPGEYGIRVAGIDREVRAPGVGVHEQHARPRLAAVRRAIHTALRLWPVRAPQGAHEPHVGIGRVRHDPRDPPRGRAALVH